MEILKDNPKQGSWKVYRNPETHVMYSGYAYDESWMIRQGYTESIPNPIFKAKFKVEDIHWGQSSFSISVKECECPIISALKGEYGEYTIVGNGAREIILKALRGELETEIGEDGWFGGTFTFVKSGRSYAIRLYEEE